jgi:hypothetical protein
VSDVVVGVSAIETSIVVGTPTIAVRTHFWTLWAEIAIEQEAASRRARTAAQQLMAQHSSEAVEMLARELKASIVCVAAAAHAIDAVNAVFKTRFADPRRVTWSRNRTPRPMQIFETLRSAATLGRATEIWRVELGWLFGLRDAAVHFEEADRDTEPHPLGTNTAPENVRYSSESSQRAVDFLLEVLNRATLSPRARYPEVAKWASTYRIDVERLMDKRSQLRS